MTRRMSAAQVKAAGLVIVGDFGIPPTAGWIVCRPEDMVAVRRLYDEWPEGDLGSTLHDDFAAVGGEYVIEA